MQRAHDKNMKLKNTFLNVEVSFLIVKFVRDKGLLKDETLKLGFVFKQIQTQASSSRPCNNISLSRVSK